MRVLAATAQRNEGPFLIEWLAWHRLIGVTDFLVYSNDCQDGSDALLDALAMQGVVRHAANPRAAGKSVQWSALNAAWRDPLRKAADWMLISDVDEFAMIHAGGHRLADLFAALDPQAEAVALPWRLFGAGGQDSMADTPVTARFQASAPPTLFYPIAATFFKTLFRPTAFARPGIHRPRHRKDHVPRWQDGAGRALAAPLAQNDTRLSLLGAHQARSLVEMHHYSLRSAQDFVVKSARGLPNRSEKAIDLSYWVERNFNTVPNPAAQALQAPLAAEIAALKALPGVAALHEQAVEWHRARFAALMRQRGAYALYAQILLAGDSAVLPAAQAQRVLAMFGGLEDGG